MTEAPVIVFVVNSLGKSILTELTTEEGVYEICNMQSISASIQNMLLAATEKEIGKSSSRIITVSDGIIA